MFLPPGHPALRTRGWPDRRDDSASVWHWAGTGVALTFRGAALVVHLQGRGMVEVLLDGKLLHLLGPDLPEEPVALHAPAGEHRLEIRRRSEPLVGPTRFLGIELPASATIPPTRAAEPYLLFLGDSITCGYGNLAPDTTHPFRPETEDVFSSYAGIACQELSTGFQACAWSGKGLQRNFDRDGSPTIPEIWWRTSPLDPGSPPTEATRPLACVVNLGTNDVYHDDPDWAAFGRDMAGLGLAIRSVFPHLPLVLLDGPLLTDQSLRAPDGALRPLLTRMRAALDQACERLRPDGPTWRFSLTPCLPDEPRGADGHPSAERHRVAGRELARFLRPLLPPA